MEFTNDLQLYKPRKTDTKQATLDELANNADKLETALEKKAQQSYVSLSDKVNPSFLFSQTTEDSTYNKIQGMCVTNKYIVVAVIGTSDSDLTRLYVFDKNTFALSTDFAVNPIKDRSFGHANSLTYNSKTNQVIICSLDTTIWVLNGDTLATVQTITLPYACSGIAYDSVNDQYIAKSGITVSLYDSNFTFKSTFSLDLGVSYISQGMEYHNDMLFIPFYDTTNHTTYGSISMIFVYTMTGKLIRSYNLGYYGELEDLAYVDGRFYANFALGGNIHLFSLNILPQITFSDSDVVEANERFLNYGNVPSGSDLNNFMKPGLYKILGSGVGSTLLNCPTAANARLEVKYVQNNPCVEQIVTSRDGHKWVRTYDPTGTGWTIWRQMDNDDSGWISITPINGFTTNATIERSSLSARKIGNHVFVSGGVTGAASTTGTIQVAQLPSGFAPKIVSYRLIPSSGFKVTRIFASSNGYLYIDWCWDMSTAAKDGSSIWHDMSIDFWID